MDKIRKLALSQIRNNMCLHRVIYIIVMYYNCKDKEKKKRIKKACYMELVSYHKENTQKEVDKLCT